MPEYAAVLIKTFLLFFAVILISRLVGRRWLAARTGWERVWMMIFAFFVAGLAVNLIPLREGLLALAMWTGLAVLVNYMMLKSKAVRDLLEGREIVAVQHGKVLEDNLWEARMNPEDFLRQLRSKQIFQVADVDFAVIESDGEVNVLLKSDQKPLTPADFGRVAAPEDAPQTVILDGNILDEGLRNLGLNRGWLLNELEKKGISAENVLIGQVDSHGDLYVDLFDDALQVPPPSTRQLLEAQLEQAEADLRSYSLEVKDPAVQAMFQECSDKMRQVRQELEPLLR